VSDQYRRIVRIVLAALQVGFSGWNIASHQKKLAGSLLIIKSISVETFLRSTPPLERRRSAGRIPPCGATKK
jgi:hypothetical protein